ncbi:MAG TPA: hypothetical protein VL728_07410 [Cyclobacteriaceae bacterium]|nr:hypothetical protein [Cyclobacteriaceae bacterium]
MEILEAHEASPCIGGQKNANVYRVRVLDSNDTIYVFELCSKMKWRENSRKFPLAVERSEDDVIDKISVPIETHIRPNSKFVKGSIVQLII